MDPMITGIGAKVVEKLIPYVTEGAKRLTQAVGDAANNVYCLRYVDPKANGRCMGLWPSTDPANSFEKDVDSVKKA